MLSIEKLELLSQDKSELFYLRTGSSAEQAKAYSQAMATNGGEPLMIAQRQQIDESIKLRGSIEKLTSATKGNSSSKSSSGNYIKPFSDSFSYGSPMGTRLHPVYKEQRFHAGHDVPMPVGTDLRAVRFPIELSSFLTSRMADSKALVLLERLVFNSACICKRCSSFNSRYLTVNSSIDLPCRPNSLESERELSRINKNDAATVAAIPIIPAGPPITPSKNRTLRQ